MPQRRLTYLLFYVEPARNAIACVEMAKRRTTMSPLTCRPPLLRAKGKRQKVKGKMMILPFTFCLLPLPDRAFHLQLDQAVQLDRVFHRQLARERLHKA